MKKPENIRYLWRTWYDIIRRCYNENREAYKSYGGRGIKVCDEWKNDYQVFKAWAILNGWQYGLTIDRKDVNGDYEPKNCRIVTKSINSKENKRKLLLIEYMGQRKSLRDWASILNISYSAVYYHIVTRSLSPENVLDNLSKGILPTKHTEPAYFHWNSIFDKSNKIDVPEIKFTPAFNDCKDLKSASLEFEYNYIIDILNQRDGNITETANVLKVERKTIYNILERYEKMLKSFPGKIIAVEENFT